MTKLSDNEKTKFQSLSRLFLYKVAECIYETRCPQDLPDFEPDPSVFSLSVKKSSSLRSLLTYKSHYGWFQIDLILTNPDIIIERWHLIHLPLKIEVPNQFPTVGELREYVYRQFSQIIRSIYSMCNILPSKTLQIQIQKLPTNTRRIKAVCEPFHALPAVYESISEYETGRIQFGPIITPVGRTVVFCTHRIDLDNEIPCPISTAQHYNFTLNSSSNDSDDLIEFNQNFAANNDFLNGPGVTGLSYDPNASALTSIFSTTPGSFSSFRAEDFLPQAHVSEDSQDSQNDIEEYSLNDFQQMIENCLDNGIDDTPSLEKIKQRYHEIAAEIDEKLRF